MPGGGQESLYTGTPEEGEERGGTEEWPGDGSNNTEGHLTVLLHNPTSDSIENGLGVLVLPWTPLERPETDRPARERMISLQETKAE